MDCKNCIRFLQSIFLERDKKGTLLTSKAFPFFRFKNLLKQSVNNSVFFNVDLLCRRNLGKTGHCHNVTRERNYKARTCRNLNLLDGNRAWWGRRRSCTVSLPYKRGVNQSLFHEALQFPLQQREECLCPYLCKLF